MDPSPTTVDALVPDAPWRRWPWTIPGTDPRWFTFPEAEGDQGLGATTWFLEGRLRGRTTGRELAVMTIFALNRIVAPFRIELPAGFHVLALFDLDGGRYGTTTEFDLPRPGRIRRGTKLHTTRGLLDVSYDTRAGRSRWSVRRDAAGAPQPFRYALDLVGVDGLGRTMEVELDVDPTKPPAPVGGDDLRGVKTCCAQLGTFSYFQTGLSMRGRVSWGDLVDEVDGDVGWIDRQFAREHFGAYTDLRNTRHRHEWRVLHLDNGWDLSVWSQYDARRGDRLVPFSGVTAQGPDGEVRSTTDFRVEHLSFVRDPRTIRAQVPLTNGPAWLADRFHLSVRDWGLSVTADPLVPTPVHGMPIEYWNGPVRVVGEMAGRPVSGFGFHERSRVWHEPHDLVWVLRETLAHLPTGGAAGREARVLADRAWNCDVLLARGDRAGARRLLIEQVSPGIDRLPVPGREPARQVLDDLLAVLR